MSTCGRATRLRDSLKECSVPGTCRTKKEERLLLSRPGRPQEASSGSTVTSQTVLPPTHRAQVGPVPRPGSE